jgi:hypothetical protein
VVTRNEFREHLVVPVAVLKAVGQYASKLQPGKVKEKAEP